MVLKREVEGGKEGGVHGLRGKKSWVSDREQRREG
jgi:hypothetical protein